MCPDAIAQAVDALASDVHSERKIADRRNATGLNRWALRIGEGEDAGIDCLHGDPLQAGQGRCDKEKSEKRASATALRPTVSHQWSTFGNNAK
jgi:hypothetical protein